MPLTPQVPLGQPHPQAVVPEVGTGGDALGRARWAHGMASISPARPWLCPHELSRPGW